MIVITPNDRLKSAPDCCVIHVLIASFCCLLTFIFWWYGGFCHRLGQVSSFFLFTENANGRNMEIFDLFSSLRNNKKTIIGWAKRRCVTLVSTSFLLCDEFNLSLFPYSGLNTKSIVILHQQNEIWKWQESADVHCNVSIQPLQINIFSFSLVQQERWWENLPFPLFSVSSQ